MLQGKVVQQVFQIVLGVAQGRFLLGSQQPFRRVEDEAAFIIGRQRAHLVAFVQLVQHRPGWGRRHCAAFPRHVFGWGLGWLGGFTFSLETVSENIPQAQTATPSKPVG
jgi:hypothetical protein